MEEEKNKTQEKHEQEDNINGSRKERIQITLPRSVIYKILEINRRYGYYKQESLGEDLKVFITIAIGVLETLNKNNK